ncbi:MAG: hypothetical protein ACJAU6_004171, partial [Alphaproteobacteria bacterium]
TATEQADVAESSARIFMGGDWRIYGPDY